MSAMLTKFMNTEKLEEKERGSVEPELLNIRSTFEKFSSRYVGDEELQGICDEFEEYLQRKDEELMSRITWELEELMYLRRLGSLVGEMRSKGQNNRCVNLT